MNILQIEVQRNRVLLALYHLATTKTPHVDVEELEQQADVGDDFYDILRYLQGNDLLKKSNMVVRITSGGIDRAEGLIKMQMAEKQRVVLREIYDMSAPSHTSWVIIDELRKELGMEFRELNDILLDFERRKGWVGSVEEAVWLTPAGVIEYEQPKREPTVGGVATHIQNVFNAPFQGGLQQGGQGHVQHNIFNNNPKLDETVSALIELIQNSGINELDKEDVIRDVQRLRELALKEKTPDVIERAQTRLEAVNTVLETGEKSGELLKRATPYLLLLWQLIIG